MGRWLPGMHVRLQCRALWVRTVGVLVCLLGLWALWPNAATARVTTKQVEGACFSQRPAMSLCEAFPSWLVQGDWEQEPQDDPIIRHWDHEHKTLSASVIRSFLVTAWRSPVCLTCTSRGPPSCICPDDGFHLKYT